MSRSSTVCAGSAATPTFGNARFDSQPLPPGWGGLSALTGTTMPRLSSKGGGLQGQPWADPESAQGTFPNTGPCQLWAFWALSVSGAIALAAPRRVHRDGVAPLVGGRWLHQVRGVVDRDSYELDLVLNDALVQSAQRIAH
jgi:hypothetical protein